MPKHRKGPPTPVLIEEYQAGATPAQLAKKYAMNRAAIKGRIERAGQILRPATWYCSICGNIDHRCTFHNQPTEKSCGTCKQLLPLDRFRSYINHRRGRQQHCISWNCISCHSAYTAKRYTESFRNMLLRRVASMKSVSRRKGIHYATITVDQLEQLLKQQNGKCFYSGLPMSHQRDPYAVSVDRRDSSQGYTLDNIVLTCWIVNDLKGDLPEQTFLDLCRAIAANHAFVTK
jgi:hypothetical protein